MFTIEAIMKLWEARSVHVRLSSVTRRGKTYQYAQLVESVRREDGLPVHRVVANLGRVSDPVQLENLKAAFVANRAGQRLTPVTAATAEPALETARLRRPLAILRYLDVAVVVAMLQELGLRADLARLLPQEESDVAPERIITALLVQRCLEPQSKLAAVRWFPRTALPELLGVSFTQFNNTRIHRVLEQLETIEHDLMRSMSRCAFEQHGRFATMFLDLTDTWFTGEGPGLGKQGKTKEGMYRKKIGIALLCNEQGHPLRWEVVEGNSAEGPQMLQVMRTVQQVPWLEKIPIVCDRAMGRTVYICEMLDAGVQFITSLLSPEFDSYGVKLPCAGLYDLAPAKTRGELEDCAAAAAERVRSTGLEQLSDNLFYADLGVVECPSDRTKPKEQRTTPSEALRIGLSLLEGIASGKFATCSAAARSEGLHPQRGLQYRFLARLEPDIQQEVLAGRVDGCSLDRMLKIAQTKEKEEQRVAFNELLRETPSYQGPYTSHCSPDSEQQATGPRQVRCVAYFNPEIFARQRWLAQNTVNELQSLVQQLNQRLSDPRNRLLPRTALRSVEDRLRQHDLLTIFEVKTETVATDGHEYQRLELIQNEELWRRRRSFDGFTVLVAHREVTRSAAELCRTYRAKAAVETDFQVIKSLIKLRPVRHRTDAKVRAHVTLCMLALYVQRELTLKLKKEGISAGLALEELEPCRLSLHGGSNARGDAYVLPHPSREQTAILRRLGLTRLVDPRELRVALTPRSEFVSTEVEEVA
jgi:transposase